MHLLLLLFLGDGIETCRFEIIITECSSNMIPFMCFCSRSQAIKVIGKQEKGTRSIVVVVPAECCQEWVVSS